MKMLTRDKVPGLVVVLILLAVVAGGISRISFNVDVLRLLPQELNHVRALGVLMKHFGLPQEMVLTVETADPELSARLVESLAERLAANPALAEKIIARPPWMEHPEDLTELIAYQAINQDPADFVRLLEKLRPEIAAQQAEESLEEIATSFSGQNVAMLSYDPFKLLPADQLSTTGSAPSDFSSSDGRFRVIYVQAPGRAADYREMGNWVDDVWKTAQDWRQALPDGGEGVEIGMTGEPVFVVEISRSMQSDMMLSGFLTMVVVSLLFWLIYRRLILLIVILNLLVLTFAVALGIAGYFIAGLTVMSVGFASILLGLSIDYAMITYNAWIYDGGTLKRLRADVAPGVFWAAGTTALAFFSLNASSFPGLAQLGTMVGMGVVAGAFLMVFLFGWAVTRLDPQPRRALPIEKFLTPRALCIGRGIAVVWVVVAAGALLSMGLPQLQHSSDALRPRTSIAYKTMDRLSERLLGEEDTMNLVVWGESPQVVEQKLQTVTTALQQLQADGLLTEFQSPAQFWPAANWQSANLASATGVFPRRAELQGILNDAGFTDDAFALTDRVLDYWETWSAAEQPLWPQEPLSQWLVRRAMSLPAEADQVAALGYVTPAPGVTPQQLEDAMTRANVPAQAQLTGWAMLGSQLADFAAREMMTILLLFSGVIVLMLILALRNWRDVVLALLVLGLNAVALLGIMSILQIDWNFLNVGAALLLLGTSIDFSIHLLRGLQQSAGDQHAVQLRVGNALFVCGLTTIIGFGSISFADNQGLASLGQVCALGHLSNLFVSIFLLPTLWQWSRTGFRSQPDS